MFEKEENYIEDFLSLPKLLYSSDKIVQNEKEERELLFGEHVLSKYFRMYKFIVYNETKPCGRCVLTIYPSDDTSYIGLFECVNDTECSKLLFESVSKISAENNCTRVKGPVDASFWIRYRLKTNNFHERPYVSEPYNKEYYLELFLNSGYKIIENYISNYYEKAPMFSSVAKKCENRLKSFMDRGYVIKSPSKDNFDSVVREIYVLITELYKDFPVFKHIESEDFLKHFSSYKYILDPSFVKIAYYNNMPVGFVIGMPDYGNMLYKNIGFLEYIKISLKKIRSSRYVMLYIGVKPEHRGLGSALTQIIIQNIQKKRSTSIGALIRQGKVTQGYVNSKIRSSNTYVLLECEL